MVEFLVFNASKLANKQTNQPTNQLPNQAIKQPSNQATTQSSREKTQDLAMLTKPDASNQLPEPSCVPNRLPGPTCELTTISEPSLPPEQTGHPARRQDTRLSTILEVNPGGSQSGTTAKTHSNGNCGSSLKAKNGEDSKDSSYD